MLLPCLQMTNDYFVEAKQSNMRHMRVSLSPNYIFLKQIIDCVIGSVAKGIAQGSRAAQIRGPNTNCQQNAFRCTTTGQWLSIIARQEPYPTDGDEESQKNVLDQRLYNSLDLSLCYGAIISPYILRSVRFGGHTRDSAAVQSPSSVQPA